MVVLVVLQDPEDQPGHTAAGKPVAGRLAADSPVAGCMLAVVADRLVAVVDKPVAVVRRLFGVQLPLPAPSSC